MTASWRFALTVARRELDWRFRGLRLLLLCLVLGTAALSAIGTLIGMVEGELARRGQVILGGDLELRVSQRQAGQAELAAMQRLGRVSASIRLQAMAARADGRGAPVPIELKAVDEAYPLYGALVLQDGRRVGAPGAGQIWVMQSLADRMALGVGGDIRLGTTTATIGGIIADEPDRLSEGFSLGPVAIVSLATLDAANLVQPGSMAEAKYRIRLPAAADPDGLAERWQKRFPAGGWQTRHRDAAAPGAERFLSRIGQFLTLIGLAALIIAGIGIGGGVSSYLEARGGVIATLKVLGATSGDIMRVYAVELGVAALAGITIGLAIGTAIVPLLARALEGLLPVRNGLVVDPSALVYAAVFGLLVALIYAAPPLLRARLHPAMALLRGSIQPGRVPWRRLVLPVGGGLAMIVGLALLSAGRPLLTVGFLGGAFVIISLLTGLALATGRIARRVPRPADPILRLAVGNLHRPGAQLAPLVTALGFGLAAFVALAAIQTSIDANIARQVPRQAPDYFVLDVPRDQAAAFRRIVAWASPAAVVETVPAMRGSITAYGPAGRMTRVSELETIPEAAWPLRGERGLTYAETLPPGNRLVAGRWWGRNYNGPPLVSIDAELAEALDLRIGDVLAISLLGVERSARIASLREIDWQSMGFNYVLVFSPNAIADAPHNLAATIKLPEGGSNPGGLIRQLAQSLPNSSVIEVGGLLAEARALLDQVGTAVLAASSVTVLAGLAVLAGAISAARSRRLYDNVILRVLGASRRQLLGLQLAEYGLLVGLLSLVGLALGTVVAWGVVTQLFEFVWLPDWPRVLATLASGGASILLFALAGSLPLLRARPAAALREL